MTNGKLNDDELNGLLEYYVMANTYGKHIIKPEDKDRVFNLLLALNELKELRQFKNRKEVKNERYN